MNLACIILFINHGFFKVLLFLSAGSVIHELGDEKILEKGED